MRRRGDAYRTREIGLQRLGFLASSQRPPSSQYGQLTLRLRMDGFASVVKLFGTWIFVCVHICIVLFSRMVSTLKAFELARHRWSLEFAARTTSASLRTGRSSPLDLARATELAARAHSGSLGRSNWPLESVWEPRGWSKLPRARSAQLGNSNWLLESGRLH